MDIARYLPVIYGIGIPFLGTVLGAACVFFVKGSLPPKVQRGMMAFAAGVMVAASVWSLLLPSIESSGNYGKLAFVPPVAGFWAGILLLFLIDKLTPHLHLGSDEPEGPQVKMKRTTMLALAVTIHNIPEGMAIGVVFAGWLAGAVAVTDGAAVSVGVAESVAGVVSLASAVAVSIGMALQNFPEGAIISLPLRAEGETRLKSFWLGVVSAIAEAGAAIVTIFLASALLPAMPYLLSLAAGAMIYVVVEELLPEASDGIHFDGVTLLFALGFSLMMVLDTAL
ncbi:ZIP family metal transporter [Fibrobacter sp. UWR1]|uniref:ZIP family metal transporter n=1 Tax=Fibrobacter sp. UWR1 TaxID=2135645 RepID=UPI000DADAC91|nr:ZIP family metal transporter [Fibrobacter sp. UWR1]PZW65498.1 ZIP family zinc transporter [Fibrobacter sp. UWR1]